jgi:hypothetical protein
MATNEPLILTPREADLMVAAKICGIPAEFLHLEDAGKMTEHGLVASCPRYTTSVDRCIEAAGKLNEAQERAYLICMHNYACEGLDIVGTAKLHRNLLNAPALIRVAAMLTAVLDREVRIET